MRRYLQGCCTAHGSVPSLSFHSSGNWLQSFSACSWLLLTNIYNVDNIWLSGQVYCPDGNSILSATISAIQCCVPSLASKLRICSRPFTSTSALLRPLSCTRSARFFHATQGIKSASYFPVLGFLKLLSTANVKPATRFPLLSERISGFSSFCL